MPAVFISYRRDDSSGHAGRLFDRLSERFGRDAIFMDVTDIAPGTDFVHSIERAVGSCDVLLVVIGREWSAGRAGTGRRLDDPNDFVRLEVSTALRRGIPVVPVLVRGAALPAAAELPEDVAPLLRRHAVTLSDDRWDSDVERLSAALARQLGVQRDVAAKPRAVPRSRLRWIAIAATLALIGAVVLYAYLAIETPESSVAKVDRGERRTVPESTPTAAAPSQPEGAPEATLEAIPEEERLLLRNPTPRRVAVGKDHYEILGLRLDPRDVAMRTLVARVRMFNGASSSANFFDESFRLITDAGVVVPSSQLNEVVAAHAAVDGDLRFVVPATLDRALLEVSGGGESTRIPLDLSVRAPMTPGSDAFGRPLRPRVVELAARMPLTLPRLAPVTVGNGRFAFKAPVLDQRNAEQASLTLWVRCTAGPGSSGVNFWSDNLRLLVDGVPRAPINSVNELVRAGQTREAEFVFVLEETPERLGVQVFNGDDRTEIPLDLAALQ